MELVDTHCHLYSDPLGLDPDAVLRRARAAGVSRVVVPAYDLASWEGVQELGARDGTSAAFGLHPWVADEPLDLERLRDILTRCNAVAVGEIGLDTRIERPDLETQVRILAAQLRLARSVGLPVILHCRGAFEELLDLLREIGPPWHGVVHAFSRGTELAERFLDLGLHLAFGGAVTRPGSRAKSTAALVPDDRILLETDAPSIGLLGVPAEQSEPRHVLDVANSLAQIRGVGLETIAEITTRNARGLFRI